MPAAVLVYSYFLLQKYYFLVEAGAYLLSIVATNRALSLTLASIVNQVIREEGRFYRLLLYICIDINISSEIFCLLPDRFIRMILITEAVGYDDVVCFFSSRFVSFSNSTYYFNLFRINSRLKLIKEGNHFSYAIILKHLYNHSSQYKTSSQMQFNMQM